MIVQLTSKKQIPTDVENLSDLKTIYCQIENFIQDETGYRINGKYITKTENPQIEGEEETIEVTYTEKIIKQFSKEFTNAEMNALFEAIIINYPEHLNYTEKRLYELLIGLKYVTSVEPVFGLSGTDWE